MIAKITDNVYLSGADQIHDLAKLKSLGITAVLNVADNIDDPQYKDLLMIKIGLYEFAENKPPSKELATKILADLVSNGHTVIVHCRAGAHRSPYIICRYLAEQQKIGILEAYKQLLPKVPWGVIYPPNIP